MTSDNNQYKEYPFVELPILGVDIKTSTNLGWRLVGRTILSMYGFGVGETIDNLAGLNSGMGGFVGWHTTQVPFIIYEEIKYGTITDSTLCQIVFGFVFGVGLQNNANHSALENMVK